MATEVNQKGYDVVSSEGEKISVKTTAMMGTGGHVNFNINTLDLVDRVIILRINTEEMQVETLLNSSTQKAIGLMGPQGKSKRSLALSKLTKTTKLREDIKTVKEAEFGDHIVRELETGSIEVEYRGKFMSPVKPELRKLAKSLNVSPLNSNGNNLNIRQLGSQIIRSINELRG
jgi:hypothetical protein